MPCMLVKNVFHEYMAVSTIPGSRFQVGGMTINIESEQKWINWLIESDLSTGGVDTKDIETITYIDCNNLKTYIWHKCISGFESKYATEDGGLNYILS